MIRRPRPALRTVLVLGAVLLFALAAWLPDRAEGAETWRDLTGRVAPDLVFAEAAQGMDPGTKLSSRRGKQVVLLVFWLRDCPHCKRELPKVQRLHQRYHRSGLEVISVVHGFPLDEVLPTMKKRGWTFPVARDPKGHMATRYGGGRRPGYYVIGIDGRVKASNALSERAIGTALAHWRLAELGEVPSELTAARNAVWQGDYGAALRAAEPLAKQEDASAAVKAAVARLQEIAGEKLQNRVDRAEAWRAAGALRQARAEYRGIVATFEHTSLEERARNLARRFEASVTDAR